MRALKFDDKEYKARMEGTGADRVQDWLFFELKRRFPERYDTQVVSLPEGACLALQGENHQAQRERFLQVYSVLEDVGKLFEEEKA